jgi:hypothetical protein
MIPLEIHEKVRFTMVDLKMKPVVNGCDGASVGVVAFRGGIGKQFERKAEKI